MGLARELLRVGAAVRRRLRAAHLRRAWTTLRSQDARQMTDPYAWPRPRARLLPSVLAVVLLAGCAPLHAGSVPPRTGWPVSASDRRCVERDGLPDPRCTPGAIRPGVSLATICAFAYSPSVPPPESYPEPLKLAQMRAYDLPD